MGIKFLLKDRFGTRPELVNMPTPKRLISEERHDDGWLTCPQPGGCCARTTMMHNGGYTRKQPVMGYTLNFHDGVRQSIGCQTTSAGCNNTPQVNQLKRFNHDFGQPFWIAPGH